MLLKVKVIAGAKNNSLEHLKDGTIKLRIAQKALDGKANKEIINYLSKVYNIPKSNINILKGEKSSHKTIQIDAFDL